MYQLHLIHTHTRKPTSLIHSNVKRQNNWRFQHQYHQLISVPMVWPRVPQRTICKRLRFFSFPLVRLPDLPGRVMEVLATRNVVEFQSNFLDMAMGHKRKPKRGQVAGSIFPFTNRLFWAPGIFDPQPYLAVTWTLATSQIPWDSKIDQTGLWSWNSKSQGTPKPGF